MKKLHYEGFWLNVPENKDEHYSFTGAAPNKVKNAVKLLEKKAVVMPSTVVINSLRKELGIVPTEILSV